MATKELEKPRLTRKALESLIVKLGEDLEEASDPEPFVTQAQEILDKMEVDMPKGMGWLASVKESVAKNLHVAASTGRVRRLFRILTGINRAKAEAGRRAKNAPVQGISSEVGVVAGYLSYKNCYDYSLRETAKVQVTRWREKYGERGRLTSPFISRITRLVHDATYMVTPYPLLLPQIHIGLWTSTTGIAEYYKEKFNFVMAANPEVELELCAREDVAYKWDWTLPELGKIIRKSLVDQEFLGNLVGTVDEAMREIFWCYTDKVEREYLFNTFPFLDVPYEDVKDQVRKMLLEQKLIG